MATPYLGLDNDAPTGENFSRSKFNDNTQKIETALYKKRADLEDRVQIGSDWFTLASTQKDWGIYTEEITGNKVVRHGIWAMVEMQFIAKRNITIPSHGNITNQHLVTIEKGFRTVNRLAISGVNSLVDMNVELAPNGNCYVTAYNFTSTTIPKGTVVRVAGKYVYVP